MCKPSITPNATLEGDELIVIGSGCPNRCHCQHRVCDENVVIVRVNDYTVAEHKPEPIELGETIEQRLGELVSKIVDDEVKIEEVKVIPL